MNNDNRFSLEVIEKGLELGYGPHELPLLFLVPFLQVAWAEGHVQVSEQKAILSLARDFHVIPDHAGYERLVGWFDERPSDEFISRSIEDLRTLLESIPAIQATRLRVRLGFGCVQVAQAAGDIGLLHKRSNVRREELEQLQQIGERLGLAPIHI